MTDGKCDYFESIYARTIKKKNLYKRIDKMLV